MKGKVMGLAAYAQKISALKKGFFNHMKIEKYHYFDFSFKRIQTIPNDSKKIKKIKLIASS